MVGNVLIACKVALLSVLLTYLACSWKAAVSAHAQSSHTRALKGQCSSSMGDSDDDTPQPNVKKLGLQDLKNRVDICSQCFIDKVEFGRRRPTNPNTINALRHDQATSIKACTEQYAEKFYREPLRVNVAVFEHPPYATKADILNGFDPAATYDNITDSECGNNALASGANLRACLRAGGSISQTIRKPNGGEAIAMTWWTNRKLEPFLPVQIGPSRDDDALARMREDNDRVETVATNCYEIRGVQVAEDMPGKLLRADNVANCIGQELVKLPRLEPKGHRGVYVGAAAFQSTALGDGHIYQKLFKTHGTLSNGIYRLVVIILLPKMEYS